jgi:hypothetical protein
VLVSTHIVLAQRQHASQAAAIHSMSVLHISLNIALRTLCIYRFLCTLTRATSLIRLLNSTQQSHQSKALNTDRTWKIFKMLLLATFLVLLFPLRLAMADIPTATQDPTQLLTTEAITASLQPLSEIQTDLSNFMISARALYTKHFLVSHIGTADLEIDQNLTLGTDIVHDYLTEITSSEFDLDMSACAFAPFVIKLCQDEAPRVGPFSTVLKAEVLRVRRCASTVARVHKQMTELRESYFSGTSRILLLPLDFRPTIPYSASLTREENLAQSHKLKMRFFDFWDDLLELSSLTMNLPNIERSEYLQRLTILLLEAGRNASIAVYLDEYHWHAMNPYWNSLCLRARSPLVATDNSTSSSWKAAAGDVAAKWFRNGMVFKDWWTPVIGGGWWRIVI